MLPCGGRTERDSSRPSSVDRHFVYLKHTFISIHILGVPETHNKSVVLDYCSCLLSLLGGCILPWRLLQKRKEKGRVTLTSVLSIEPAVLSASPEEIGVQGEFYPFQVGYVSDDHYTLYLVALKDAERNDWLLALRKGRRISSPAKQSVRFVTCELESNSR
jgi:hypothetical protein